MNHEEITNTEHLQEQLDLYRKVVESYRLREQLLSLVGTTDPKVIASMVQSMEEQLKDFYATKDTDHPDHHSEKESIDSAALISTLGTSDAHEIITMVQNMEEQLKDFYATKDADHPDHHSEKESIDSAALISTLGTSDSHEIITMVQNMEEQLKEFYASKDSNHPNFSGDKERSAIDIMKFKYELGTSDTNEIIAMVKNMEDQLKDFYELKDEDLLSN